MKDESLLSAQAPRSDHRRSVLRVPESHTLFAGPAGCIRRHALRAHESEGGAYSSYLAVSEQTVARDGYEDLVAQAVDEILADVNPDARAVFINLFCIDDLLGTDEGALVRCLRERHPGVRFVVDRTHPIASTSRASMGDKKHVNLYSFLEAVPDCDRDQGVNLVGNFAPLPCGTELFEILGNWGFGPVRQLMDCTTYDEYADLARSRVNIVLRTQSMPAARDMELRLGIPAFSMPACYDVTQVGRRYRELAAILGTEEPDCTAYEAEAAMATERARDALEGHAIAVDCKATLYPFSLARALLDAGFDVRCILRSKHLFDADKEDERIVGERYPQVQVVRNDDPRLGTAAGPVKPDRDVVAIGSDATRLFNSEHVVNMWHDEGFFGYQGITLLMDKLATAMEGEGR